MQVERKQIKVADTNGGLEVKAKIADTYSRPVVAFPTQIESIAEAFASVNPNLMRYVKQVDEKKEDFEVAAGAQIYRKILEGGSDISVKDATKLIQEQGPVAGFKRLTKNMKQGYIKARYEHLGNTIQNGLLGWYATATTEDENGNVIPLSQLHDQNKAMMVFEKEAERRVLETTGGVYDPLLYKEFVEKPLAGARNQFIQANANRVRIENENQIKRASSALLTDTFAPLVVSGEIVSNVEGSSTRLTQSMTNQINAMMSAGLTKQDALETISQWVQSIMSSKSTPIDAIDTIMKAVEQLPDLKDDPKIIESLNISAKSSVSDKHRQKMYERQAEEEDLEEMLSSDIYNLYNNGYTKEAADAIVKKYGDKFPKIAHKAVQYTNAFRQWKDSSYQMTQSMEPDEFNQLRIAAMKGALSNSDVISALPKMNEEQQNDIINTYRSAVNFAKSQARSSGGSGGGGGASAVAKAIKAHWTTLEKEFKKFWPDPKNQEIRNGLSLANHERFKVMVMEHASTAFMDWKSKHPNATDNEIKLARTDIMQKMFGTYNNNYRIYNEQPSLLNKSPEVATVENLRRTCSTVISKLTPQGQKLFQQAAALKKSGNDYQPYLRKIIKQATGKTVLSESTINRALNKFNELDDLVTKTKEGQE